MIQWHDSDSSIGSWRTQQTLAQRRCNPGWPLTQPWLRLAAMDGGKGRMLLARDRRRARQRRRVQDAEWSQVAGRTDDAVCFAAVRGRLKREY